MWRVWKDRGRGCRFGKRRGSLVELEVAVSTMEKIRNEAMRLSLEDRARLAGELIESLDELDEVDQVAVDAAWAEEVRRRVQDFRAGKVKAMDGEDVLDRLRARFTK